MTTTGTVDNVEEDAEMTGGEAGGAEDSGSDEMMKIDVMRAELVENAALLHVYPLMPHPFFALYKPH